MKVTGFVKWLLKHQSLFVPYGVDYSPIKYNIGELYASVMWTSGICIKGIKKEASFTCDLEEYINNLLSKQHLFVVEHPLIYVAGNRCLIADKYAIGYEDGYLNMWDVEEPALVSDSLIRVEELIPDILKGGVQSLQLAVMSLLSVVGVKRKCLKYVLNNPAIILWTLGLYDPVRVSLSPEDCREKVSFAFEMISSVPYLVDISDVTALTFTAELDAGPSAVVYIDDECIHVVVNTIDNGYTCLHTSRHGIPKTDARGLATIATGLLSLVGVQVNATTWSCSRKLQPMGRDGIPVTGTHDMIAALTID